MLIFCSQEVSTDGSPVFIIPEISLKMLTNVCWFCFSCQNITCLKLALVTLHKHSDACSTSEAFEDNKGPTKIGWPCFDLQITNAKYFLVCMASCMIKTTNFVRARRGMSMSLEQQSILFCLWHSKRENWVSPTYTD